MWVLSLIVVFNVEGTSVCNMVLILLVDEVVGVSFVDFFCF